jgi:hypothetical protein
LTAARISSIVRATFYCIDRAYHAALLRHFGRRFASLAQCFAVERAAPSMKHHPTMPVDPATNVGASACYA